MADSSITPPIKVLFVCLGNICRSPLAEGVFRNLVEEAGLDDQVTIASAGTGRWHVGEPPDPRMRETARRHGLSIDDQRAQQIVARDLERYDYVLAMDRSNYSTIRELDDRAHNASKVHLFRDFDPTPEDKNVPDPYYGSGTEGFERVYRIVERTSRNLLDHLIELHDLEAVEQGRG
ncbi:MAG: low molecular weight phosphotyrosine protein phosphatase [Bacteroidetes bacterium]|nr:low molecular weight phosphotyrosine protein phosphatase [Bacteroidota bacterium]